MAKSNAKGKTPVRHNNGTSKAKGRLAEKGTPPPALQSDRPPLSHPPPPPPTFPLPEVVEEVRAELAAKAQELYQKMDPLIPRPLRERDSVSIGAEGLAIGDEQYWASVPQHIRNAVMKYYSSPPSRQQNGLDMKEVELHALAQKLVDGGFVDEHGVGPNIGLPFDPSMLENSAFDQYIKDAAATLVPIPPMDFRVDVTLEEHEIVEDDEYYSEDEQGPEVLERTTTFSKTKPSKRKKSKATVTSTVVTSVHTTKMVTAPLPERSPESRPTPQSADRRRDKSSLPPSVSSTTTTTANMPAPKSQQQPPPSSVSMGKKPMLYPPASQTPATTTTTQQQSQGKSARAASKQPLSAHAYPHNHPHHHPSSPSSNASQPQKPRPPNSNNTTSKNNKIWSTSNSEERERIKEFWLGLGEEERRNLVKIEKDTVLRKMKEQQKHSCNCAVCGRKRTAIEEELEVLYDAYYEELEQYANYQQRYVSSGRTIPPPPGPGPFPGSVEVDKDGAVVGPNSKSPHPPPRNTAKHPNGVNGRKAQLPSVKQAESEFEDDEGDDYDDEEEEYDEEEEEGEEEEEEEEEEVPEEEEEKPPRSGRQGREVPASRGRRTASNPKANGRDGLFSSLTVTGPGNILTVADDLLKNDGQKFLEMMEQLAERRMQREEEAAVNVEEDSEDEEEDEEDDDDDEEDEEEDDEEDDEEIMTEEQKMEEGKRMFSIFAARMFEQRVLQAYREKVAQERQLQLLRELEDEDKQTKEKEAKKQSQNQKKKDKKKQQKMAKEEERAQKAAEKAAEEAALKAKQFALEEDQRKRKEEERLKREADRKAREEEKQRKDEERRRRLADEKEREAEREKKRKEKEEKARREKEEKERKAREEREAKAAQEKAAAAAKREQMEKEKKEKEEKERKEREEKAEREAKERLAQQQQSQQRAASSSKTARAPPSPRNATASGSSNGQRAPLVNGTANKKILSKPPAVSTPAAGPSQIQPSTSQRSQQSRPLGVHPSQPATPITPQLSQHHHLPPQPPMFPPGPPGIIPPASALSPRTPFAPPPFGFAPGPSMQPSPTSPLAPSAIPRNFGLGGPPPPFDSPFPRGIAPIVSVPSPIGPPPKTPLPPLAPPSSLAPGSNRRASVPDPGPITRPIAPIARPTEVSTSSSGSPVRRSPSPKGVLGSSALAAEDDEVVSAPTRRSGSVGTVGHGWGPASPRGAIGDNTIRPPWASGAPPGGPIMPPGPPGFGNPRPIGNLWGAPANPDWHPTNGPFFSNTFLANTASPPPHSNS